MEQLKQINKIPLFHKLSGDQLNHLLQQHSYYIKKYPKGAFIAFRGNEISSLMILLSGEVRTEMHDLNGNVKQIEHLKRHQILAPAFLFGPKNIFPVDVIATEESSLLIIPREHFLLMMQERKEVLTAFLDLISNRAQFLSKKIWFSFSKRTIRQKIASYFLQNSSNNHVKLNITLTHLARSFDVTRPSLSREIAQMVKEGLITQIDSKHYEIPNIQMLQAISGD